MQAGEPSEKEFFRRIEVEGIPIYIREDLLDKQLEIDWFGIWFIGQFVVREL